MGVDYVGQEKAIEILREMPKEAKEYLFHHTGNALCAVMLELWRLRAEIEAGVVLRLKRVDRAMEATQHVMEDLRRIESPLPSFEELRARAAITECDEHPAVCECLYHENLRAAEATHEHGEAA